MLTGAAVVADARNAAAIDGDKALDGSGAVVAVGNVEYHTDEIINDDGSAKRVQRVIFYSADNIPTQSVITLRGVSYAVSSAVKASGHIYEYHLRTAQ